MILVRHNSLLPPFDNYLKLTVDQLDALAQATVFPDIARLPTDIPWGRDIERAFQEADFFVCSSSNRTQQTCNVLMERYGVQKEVRVDPDLDEIYFVPSLLMRTKEENPLLAVRERLYPYLALGEKGVESLGSLQKRIDNVILKYGEQNCIVFSHGFLIRLINSFLHQKKDLQKALLNISSIPAVDYLEAFSHSR